MFEFEFEFEFVMAMDLTLGQPGIFQLEVLLVAVDASEP
jgi:hypothetical protein